ncbi:uncharacterized protein LOC135690458 [Rhopilema esculentum]|uniref:uncharacterized protein LOC135690458 n=1 Tax=Rhopilema esculentum TaxID=499914 RepID=UPI0031DCA106
MKNARELKAKVTAKRGPEMSIWESKYRAEKQRAAILEEELGNLKSELAASQKKLLKSLEQKDSDEPSEQKSPRTIVGPSQLNNLKNEVRRLNKEKDRVEEDIQKTKRKLLVESQQKATAHQQLKEMRRDKKASSVKAEAVSTPRTKLSNAEQ